MNLSKRQERMEKNMEFNLLAEHRKRAGLTQKQVGDHIGISSQAVSKWENGQSEPDIETLYKLAELYNVTVDELVGKKSESTASGEEEKKPSAFARAWAKNKKKIVIALVVVAVLSAAIVACFTVLDLTADSRMLKKYEKIELGMTMDQVEKIMGKADDTHTTGKSDPNSFSAMVDLSTYGYAESDFWFYYGREYEKMQKKYDKMSFEEALEAEIEGELKIEPYCQARIVFDKDGKVIETYFNAVIDPEEISFSQYGDGKDKVMSTIEFLEEENATTETTETSNSKGESFLNQFRDETKDARITFEDGSIYVGEVTVRKRNSSSQNPEQYIDHPWGEITVENGSPNA